MNKEEIESLKNDVLEEIDMLGHDVDWLKAVETEQDADDFNKYSEKMIYGDGCELKMLRL